jgi:hypothetical protein
MSLNSNPSFIVAGCTQRLAPGPGVEVRVVWQVCTLMPALPCRATLEWQHMPSAQLARAPLPFWKG